MMHVGGRTHVGSPRVVTQPYRLLDASNRVLVQRVGDGSIITRFEKTPSPVQPTDVVCPHFLELKWATGCPFDCAWCYLKGTLRFTPGKTRPRVKEYGKIEQHVRAFLTQANGGCELLNTGELADSLMWERNGNPFSKFILSLFAEQERHRVLFVTKATHIAHLLEADHHYCAVVSFSLNADPVAREFEKGAPPVAERIEAARRLSNAGYDVRVRIDPMVPVAGWEEEYRKLVDELFARFRPARITLGSLRGLQSTINQAADKSWVKYLSERSGWGKKVDFQTRQQMYALVIAHLRNKYGYDEIGLCKETLSMWRRLGMDYRRIKCNCVL